MATVTPVYNWPVPTSTDYVKDGATAIESLGDAIDSSLNSITGGKNVAEVMLGNGTITNTNTVNITNFLSDTYKTYRLYLSFKSSTTNTVYLRVRENTTDRITGYYGGGNFGSTVGGTGLYNQRNGASDWILGDGNQFNFSQVTTTIYRANASSALISTQGWDEANGRGYHSSGACGGVTNFSGLSILTFTGLIATGTWNLTGIRF